MISPHIYNPIDLTNSPPSLSMLGLQNNVFNIINDGDSFGLDTRLSFKDSIMSGLQPETNVFLKINTESSKILFFTDTVWSQAITKFYHIIYDPDLILYNLNDSDIGIVEYTYNSITHNLTSNIISYGKLQGNKYEFDQTLLNTYNTKNNSIEYFELDSNLRDNSQSNNFINHYIGFIVDNVIISSETAGSGYKLNSTFFLSRSPLTSELLEADCELSCKLCLSEDTIVIEGGSNYKVGDIFSIGDIGNIDEDEIDTSARIIVTEIDDNGAIVATEISYPGIGFTQSPTVTYEGSTGTGADITFNDSFGISSCDVINGGNGYIYLDNIIVANYNGVEYNLDTPAQAIIGLVELLVEPLLNNNFSLESISVTEPGNNMSNINFDIISKNTIIDNQYISTNASNLISVAVAEKTNNRPRFLYIY